MTSDDMKYAGSAFARMLASPGMQHLNRAHARTFSLNILEMNALELREAVNRVQDPEQGIFLLSQDNKEAGRQAHREIARHVHNFLAAAKTLVDHTRVFMDEHYGGTPLQAAYRARIASTLAEEPVIGFVHDLRNYMLHKGLPDTHMFANFEQETPGGDGARLETGVRLAVEPLASWSKLTSIGRRYVTASGEALDLHVFVEDYLKHVRGFQAWLDEQLAEHHRGDLAETAKLKAEVDAETPLQVVEEPSAEPSPIEPFAWTDERASAINAAATALLSKVRAIQFPSHAPENFPSQRPTTTAITDKEIIGTPIFTGLDVDGVPVVSFIERRQARVGLSADDYEGIEDLAEIVLREPWAKSALGHSFIEDQFISWGREAFGTLHPIGFAETLASAARVAVREYTVSAPVAHLEVQTAFKFGPVSVEPITPERIDEFRAIAPEPSPEQKEMVDQLFADLRNQIQGRAAIVIKIKAEPDFAQQRGLLMAQDAITLMRVFSPGSPVSQALCPTALVGSDIVPSSKLIVSSETSFSITEGLLSRNIAFWRLSTVGLAQAMEQGLGQAGILVDPEGLSRFELDVRSSLMTFSRGLASPDLLIRLAQAFTALEGILLRHEIEPREASMARRMALMMRSPSSEPDSIGAAVMRGYRLLRQPRGGPLSPREEALVAQLAACAQPLLLIALRNTTFFGTKAEFLDAVDNLEASPE